MYKYITLKTVGAGVFLVQKNASKERLKPRKIVEFWFVLYNNILLIFFYLKEEDSDTDQIKFRCWLTHKIMPDNLTNTRK